jgi:TolA-binding protein
LAIGASALAASASAQKLPSQADSPIAQVDGQRGQWPGQIDEFNRGLEALKAKKYHDAIIDFRHVLGAYPRNPNVWIMLGVAKQESGDVRGAHGAFAQAVKFDDGNIAARGRLGAMAAELGNVDEAQSLLADLQTRSAGCGTGCADRAAFTDAIAAVQDALAHPPTDK